MILSGRICLIKKYFQPTVMNSNSQSKKNGYQVLNNISMNYQLLCQTNNVKIQSTVNSGWSIAYRTSSLSIASRPELTVADSPDPQTCHHRFILSFSGIRCPFDTFLGLKERGRPQLTALQSTAPTDKYQKSYIAFPTNVYFSQSRQ